MGAIDTTKDRDAVAEQEQDKDQEEGDPHWGPAGPVDRVRATGGEGIGEERGLFEGEELDHEEEPDREEQEADGAEESGDGFGYGLTPVPDEEWHDNSQGDEHGQEEVVRRPHSPVFKHFSSGGPRERGCVFQCWCVSPNLCSQHANCESCHAAILLLCI